MHDTHGDTPIYLDVHAYEVLWSSELLVRAAGLVPGTNADVTVYDRVSEYVQCRSGYAGNPVVDVHLALTPANGRPVKAPVRYGFGRTHHG